MSDASAEPTPARAVDPVSAIAFGAVSGLGIGAEAFRAAVDGAPAVVSIARDATLADAGLARPFASRAPAHLGSFFPEIEADRATSLLACALAQVLDALAVVRPGFRAERIGVAMGTSSGGMISAERFFAARAAGDVAAMRAIAPSATYFAPLARALSHVGLRAPTRSVLVLAACAASTIAMGLAARWLERDACDLVLAGGFDGLSLFVAAGFEALRATTASRPRPFAKGRDGMSLGEGAGVAALVRTADLRGAAPLFSIAGFGASTDAVHITAPDPSGAGLRRAAQAAIAEARGARIDLVSAHATATPYNDAMEAKAIREAVGDPDVIVHPFKAQIGHTLGAAGILETLAIGDALARSIAPAAAIDGEPDPEAHARMLRLGERRPLSAALKLSAAFGGANAALVVRPPVASDPTRLPERRSLRRVFVVAGARAGSIDLAHLSEATGIARDRLGRLDTLCRLGLSAVGALAAIVGRAALEGAGIVAGHALATLETNDLFDAKKRSRGPTGVEPRLFPATSPNAIAGECAIAFRLTGPSFATGSGLDGGTEALACAAELLAAGDADRVVVVAADDVGPATRAWLDACALPADRVMSGAAALLLSVEPSPSAAEVALDTVANHDRADAGHQALIPWIPRETPSI